MQSDLHASECECVCTFGSMCNSFLLLYNDMQLSCMFDPPPPPKKKQLCMHGMSNPIQLPCAFGQLLVSIRINFELICLGVSVMNSTCIQYGGSRPEYICIQVWAIVHCASSNLCICENFCQLKLEGLTVYTI